MARKWADDRATYIAAVGTDREAADAVGFLFDLATSPPTLHRRAGAESHPTFLADMVRGKAKWYLYSVSPGPKRVYFVPRRVDALLRDRRPTWFEEKLRQAFGSALHVGVRGYYWSVALRDVVAQKDAMQRLVDETTQHARRP